jgi:hypothetical protein
MKYIFPAVALTGGIACILLGHGLAGMFLCFFSLMVYDDCLKGDK